MHAGELLVFVKLGFAPVEHSSHSRSVVALGSLDILDPVFDIGAWLVKLTGAVQTAICTKGVQEHLA